MSSEGVDSAEGSLKFRVMTIDVSLGDGCESSQLNRTIINTRYMILNEKLRFNSNSDLSVSCGSGSEPLILKYLLSIKVSKLVL